MALLCSSAAEVGGVVFLWLTLLLPMGLWLATRVRRQLVKNDGVPDQAVLQPLFKPE